MSNGKSIKELRKAGRQKGRAETKELRKKGGKGRIVYKVRSARVAKSEDVKGFHAEHTVLGKRPGFKLKNINPFKRDSTPGKAKYSKGVGSKKYYEVRKERGVEYPKAGHYRNTRNL